MRAGLAKIGAAFLNERPTTPVRYSVFDGITAAVTIVAAAIWCTSLVRYWGAKPEYTDRFLVLLGSVWATFKLWSSAPTTIHPRPFLGLPIVLAGCGLYTIGWLVPARGTGVLSIWLWLIAIALIVSVAGIILTRRGWSHLRHFAFPLVFVLFALQPPTLLLQMLQGHLQAATTSASAAVFSLLGYSVTRTGYILELPGGALGVEEACSGIRSLTALTALAAFVAFLKNFGPFRGTVLVVLTVPVVIAANVLRVVVSGVIQENFGTKYVRGDWHEALGFGVIIVGLGLILGLARILRSETEPEDTAKTSPRLATLVDPLRPVEGEETSATGSPSQGRREGWAVRLWNSNHPWSAVACALIAMMAAGASWVVASRSQATPELVLLNVDLNKIPRKLGGWESDPTKDMALPESVREELGADTLIYRLYTNNLGYKVGVWVIVWSSPESVKGYHHPDVCLPGRGANIKERWVEAIPTSGGIINCTARRLTHAQGDLMTFYWTQEGKRIWTEEDEWRAVSQLGGLRGLFVWGQDELKGRRKHAPEPRLVVQVASEDVGEAARQEIADFTVDLADAVYTVCPWADISKR